MRGLRIIEIGLLAQRGHMFCWVPVCIGIGIGLYFGLDQEPNIVMTAVLGIGALCLLIASRLVTLSLGPLVLALALIVTGGVVAKTRTEQVAAPVLGFRYYGAIQGRIINVDRSASDAARLTLDLPVLERISPAKTPTKIRISVHGDDQVWTAGDVIMTTGHLSPPSGPAEPGGFDFQRHAWFLELGAVGYTRNPVVRLQAAKPDGWGLWVFSKRRALSQAVQAAIPGEAGAFAAAIMTGDRSGISQQTLANLRETNLAHLLAISGLHMGLLTGFVFMIVRVGLALIPIIALRVPTKKVAALIALLVGAGYLAMSGGNVATQRAYIMVAMMLVAVLLDRQALTLRAVAMAATIILVLHPEALVGPGFQMSFAATTALVVVFRGLRHINMERLPKWTRPIVSVVISSAVAGFATAPFAAAHFNMIAHYGLIANLLSVPLMGVLVMPAAVFAMVLAPFGMWDIGLWLMEKGLSWILFVASHVAAIEGGVGHVVAPQSIVLTLLSLGALWLILWRGRLRYAGGLAVAASFVLWSQTTRPAILVSDNGTLIGLMGREGRVLSKPKGSGFVAGIWLENDGDRPDQKRAASRDGLDQSGRITTAVIGGTKITQISGKTALATVIGCDRAQVLILTVSDPKARPCDVYDVERLRQTGALAIDLDETGALVITTSRDVAGDRRWNAGTPKRRRRD